MSVAVSSPNPETLAGIAQAREHAHAAWMILALDTIHRVASVQAHLTADDIEAVMDNTALVYTHDKRAMGAVLVGAKKRGFIEPTNEFRSCTRRNQHNCPKRVWRSRLI